MEIIKNEEAQFMLLAGFIIALGLVIMSVLLSNIIFQGNMAGEAGADPLKYEIVNLMQISGNEMKSAYRNATNSSAPKSTMIANFTSQTQNFNGNLSRIYALRGEGVNVSMDVSNWNNNLTANFTENGTKIGEKNWTVMESVQNVSVFKLTNVTRTGIGFTVYVTNQNTGAFLWSMKLLDNTTPPFKHLLIIRADGGPNYYDANYENIDLLGSFPPNYGFYTNVAGNISKIEFRNGADASGRFNVIGYTSYGRDFTRARDYILYSTVTLSTSRMRANITIPVSVPW